jgi:hypothetical protein
MMSKKLAVAGAVSAILLGGAGIRVIADTHAVAGTLAYHRISITNDYVPDGTLVGGDGGVMLALSNNIRTPDITNKTLKTCIDYTIIHFIPLFDTGRVCATRNLYRPAPAAPQPPLRNIPTYEI